MTELRSWRVVARNSFIDSENPIHRDAPARALGFRSGLVAGVTIYGYLLRPTVAHWGRDWLERGTAKVRFRRPVFDGDVLDVLGSVDGEGEIHASIGSGEGGAVATGTFALGTTSARLSTGDHPVSPLPAQRARPDPSIPCTLGELGSLRLDLTAERCASCLAAVSNDLDVFERDGLAHPALLLDGANLMLMANVELGPWIHIGSAVVHLRPLQVGATLSFRGRIAEVDERKGRPTLSLDIVVLDETGPAAKIHHELIYDARTIRGTVSNREREESMTQQLQHFIGGELVAGTGGRFGSVFNPATGEVESECPYASAAEIDAAVDVATLAGAAWARTSIAKRLDVIFNFRNEFAAARDHLADLIGREHGKTLGDAHGELQRSLEAIEFACSMPHLTKGEYSLNIGGNIDNFSVHQPLGVVGCILAVQLPGDGAADDGDDGCGSRECRDSQAVRAGSVRGPPPRRVVAPGGPARGRLERGQRRQGGRRRDLASSSCRLPP